MRILIIGAGLEGVVAAWYLARDGHSVTVVERREGPGLETSRANGGQISVSHPEPWANPRAPGQILRWLGREDAPLLFRLPAESERWRWGLSFLRECLPWRAHRNTEAIARLAAHSLECLRELRRDTRIDYDCQTRGVMHLFFHKSEFRDAGRRAKALERLGVHARVLDPDECVHTEPALRTVQERLQGGLYGIDDESGDAWQFTTHLAERLAEMGVNFCYGNTVTQLEVTRRRITGAHVRDTAGRSGLMTADAVVLAAGPWSAPLAQQAGVRLPIYPVKGYSVTLPIADQAKAPTVSLTDESRRIVCSRLGDRLRVAGTAELNGFDTRPNPARTDALLDWVETNLPGATEIEAAEHWNGLRPATPNNIPIIGASRVSGLWFNTGHGTLGWTLACGSGQLLADLVAGRAPRLEGFPLASA